MHVIVVGHTVCRVVDVLEDQAKVDGIVDRLLPCRDVDALHVAATFDIEHTNAGPDVLVIADQEVVWIGGECCLAGAREECNVTILFADVHRGVEG